MIHSYSAFLSPLNDEIQQFFSAPSISAVTGFKTAYLLVYAAGNLVFGFLANRVSPRVFIAAGMGINALAVIGYGFVPPTGIGLMYLLWMLAAVGGSVYHPIANVLISNLFPEKRGWAIGISGIGAGFGFAVGPLLTALLSHVAGLSWQGVAVCFGAAGLAASAAAGLWVAEHPREAVLDASGRPAAAVSPPRDEANSRSATKMLWIFLGLITVAAGFREIAMWTILDVSAFFIKRVSGPEANVSLLLFLLYVPAIVVQPLAGHLSDRLGRVKMAAIAMALYALSIASLSILPAEWFFLAYLSMGTWQTASVPVMEALVADAATKKTRGLFFGFYLTAGIGFGALGPLFFGLLIDGMGRTIQAFNVSLVALAVFVAMGAGILARVGRLRGHRFSGASK
jgi:MFS transporter, FSR family, fosmidomycin resistance protein